MTHLQKPDFKGLADRWPSAWVARTEVDRFTGGIVSEKYLANLDSKGRTGGPYSDWPKGCLPD